ncbi:eukaryotic translation initiation factor 4B [Eupeodes corollae]|uniref:eukaryotic translation initiation factor 4B n=1 Tax=Eupeodes corollae TaxID=290404 RepID=UPI00248F53FE|nr:eukaryotic translation initiation factor 4B [Eupeodes corollae]
MASSGKKGKKNKGTVISLQSFLANGELQAGITQVAKKVRSYGNDSDDDDGSLPQVYQLPTAPRASRIFDDDSIPHKPPFLAYISNLPFDANEDDIHDFFYPIELVSLRLPREDGETGRVRGFGYAEFVSRDDLIHVISLPDPQVKNRRVRIEVSNESEQQSNQRRNRDGGGGGDRNSRRGYDVFGSGENRESTNWRRDKEESGSGGGGGGGGGGGRHYDRMGLNRDRGNRDGSGERGGGGSWRTGERPVYDSSPRRGGDGYRDRFRDRGDRDRFDRDRGEGGRSRRDEDPTQERPKLNLAPRTLPLPEIISKPEPAEELDADQKQNESGSDAETKSKAPPRPAGIPAEKVFGSAKPVDTAAREKQIEERLERERLERELREKEQKENVDEISEKVADVELNKDDKETRNTAISSWRRRDEDDEAGKKNSLDRRTTHDRRTGGDDRRGRDNRDYNRDNRNRDRNDRNDRYNKDRPNNRDDRPRDDSKHKREPRPERPMPKYQPPTAGPILQTANKYSGLLDDEGSD